MTVVETSQTVRGISEVDSGGSGCAYRGIALTALGHVDESASSRPVPASASAAAQAPKPDRSSPRLMARPIRESDVALKCRTVPSRCRPTRPRRKVEGMVRARVSAPVPGQEACRFPHRRSTGRLTRLRKNPLPRVHLLPLPQSGGVPAGELLRPQGTSRGDCQRPRTSKTTRCPLEKSLPDGAKARRVTAPQASEVRLPTSACPHLLQILSRILTSRPTPARCAGHGG